MSRRDEGDTVFTYMVIIILMFATGYFYHRHEEMRERCETSRSRACWEMLR